MMEGFQDQKTCVDDTVIYDDSIEQNFYRVCEFLEIASRGGCTFNPKKFQFGSSEVNFLGFRVTENGIKPLSEFLDNITNFPVPQNITDVRSWFGAINQISYSFAIAPVMAPFRHLLSSKVPFQWSPELQEAFTESKKEIIKQCELGVRSFDPALPTALATDWSKLGMGFWLTQKHCSCLGTTPGCCNTGWQTVYCGSRFCSSAESRYHPIEGEALASINGLDKCKFFVLGLSNLTLCLDHKPLIGIFGDKNNLEEIHNPRLLNFKIKSMKFSFKPIHVPGKKNVVPDTFSRRGDSPVNSDQYVVTAGYSENLGPPAWVSPPLLSAITADTEELMQGNIIASLAFINAPITAETTLDIISWQRLEAACLSCEEYTLLHQMIEHGVPEDKNSWDSTIQDYYPHRHSLVTVGPVVMLHDRPVIPRSLRPAVMSHLHAGHASASSMFERAATCLYWPHFRSDLINHRAACKQCSRYAPSNPAMPPILPEDPAYPFESVCADFFNLNSRNYLVLVDRFSNWITVCKLAEDKSENVIRVLREYISLYGIPSIFTSDGARVFTSKVFEDFCSRWGIIHRVSTAYNPRANKRAELAVKHAKRLIRGNVSQTGSLDTDALVRALLAHRNAPCPITGLSPAQILYGRVLRDPLPLQPGKFFPRQEWRQAADTRSEAYSKRKFSMQERLSRGARQLPPLQPGDQVQVQDQHGNSPRQWSKTGVVIEAEGFDSYLISLDGSRQLTKRNRKFLRKISTHPDSYKHSESAQPTPATVRPPPPPVTPPRTPRSVPAQPPAPATPPPVQTPPVMANPPIVPPLIIRRSGDEYRVVPGPIQQVSPLQTPQSSPWLPWPLSPLPPPTPAVPAHYVVPAPWPWSPTYQHQATRL